MRKEFKIALFYDFGCQKIWYCGYRSLKELEKICEDYYVVIFYNIVECRIQTDDVPKIKYQSEWIKSKELSRKHVTKAKRKIFTKDFSYTNLQLQIAEWPTWLEDNIFAFVKDSSACNGTKVVTMVKDYENLYNPKEEGIVTGRIIANVFGHKVVDVLSKFSIDYLIREAVHGNAPYQNINEFVVKRTWLHDVAEWLVGNVEVCFERKISFKDA